MSQYKIPKAKIKEIISFQLIFVFKQFTLCKKDFLLQWTCTRSVLTSTRALRGEKEKGIAHAHGAAHSQCRKLHGTEKYSVYQQHSQRGRRKRDRGGRAFAEERGGLECLFWNKLTFRVIICKWQPFRVI